jgi:hypothetical protein
VDGTALSFACQILVQFRRAAIPPWFETAKKQKNFMGQVLPFHAIQESHSPAIASSTQGTHPNEHIPFGLTKRTRFLSFQSPFDFAAVKTVPENQENRSRPQNP